MRKLMMVLALFGAMAMPATQAGAARKVKVGKPVQFAGAATVAQAPTLVQASSNADFSRVRRVVIPYFQLEVQSTGGKESSSRAFGSRMTNNVRVTYKASGVDAAAMQALADRLYADLVASFRARGIEVVDRAEARARSASYAKIEASHQTAPMERSLAEGARSSYYAPTGMGLYFIGIEDVENGTGRSLGGMGRFGGMFAGVAAIGNNLSQMSTVMAEQKAMTELDAAVVGVRIKVAFVETDALRLNGFVQVSHRATIAIQPVDTQLWVIAPPSQMARNAYTRVQYQLGSGIVPSTDAIISVDDTQSTGSRIDTAVGNVIGGLSGASSYSRAEYTVRLDPAIFAATMAETMGATQAMLVDRFRAPAAP